MSEKVWRLKERRWETPAETVRADLAEWMRASWGQYPPVKLQTLEHVVQALLAHARAQALRDAAEQLPEVGDVLRGMAAMPDNRPKTTSAVPVHIPVHYQVHMSAAEHADLIAEAEERGAARVRERVEAVLREYERLEAYVPLNDVRAALTDEAAP